MTRWHLIGQAQMRVLVGREVFPSLQAVHELKLVEWIIVSGYCIGPL